MERVSDLLHDSRTGQVIAVSRKGEAGGGHQAWGLMAVMTLEQACPGA
jgi:hypothetical protein